ncbi:hypothetical protein BLNAU_9524 [Blattamonas nauphoetae]|uniref:Uncharacterized protein n=1 Tax=Blattamonas nauphoetae TaxID=2049346 RepID=A0ABQ9XVG8_9EUKA|nr:hypothetical protein BLNAU_9524 [Blattamonas nauphoetae]
MDVDPHEATAPHSPRRREKRKYEMKCDIIYRPIDASLPPKTFRQNRCRSENSRLYASSGNSHSLNDVLLHTLDKEGFREELSKQSEII